MAPRARQRPRGDAPAGRRAFWGRLGAVAILAPLAGCAELGLPSVFAAPPPPDAPIETVASLPAALPEGADPSPGTEAAPPPETAQTVEEFDTTSVSERAAAAAPPRPEQAATEEVLGTSIASLGDPTQPGFWAETPLVSEVRPGRLVYPVTGQSVQVELRPSGDGGTRVSLPAFRVLEAPLTALPELTVVGL